jgi:hypothetical protein
LKKIFKYLFSLFNRYPTSNRARIIHSEDICRLPPHITEKNKIHIAVQCVQDPFYYALFSGLCSELRKKILVKVDLVVPQSVDRATGLSLRALLLRLPPLNILQISQWVRLWSSVTPSIAYRSVTAGISVADLVDLWRSWRIWQKIHSAEELINLSINGVFCGDLIGDTYLRFRLSAKLQIDDIFILHIIWQAHRDIRKATLYFRKNKPNLYISSYTTYIQHGIPVRVALREGIKVLSFGNAQELGMFHRMNHVFQTRYSLLYKKDFSLIVSKDSVMALAKAEMESRMSGGIDNTTSSMKMPAYGSFVTDLPNLHNSVVIFMHDFYDSPHVYANFIFADFWDWITFTIKVLNRAGITFYLKPHPNQVESSKNVLDDLKNEFSDLNFLPIEADAMQLASVGIVCGITAYGTISSELAYLGIPSIACAEHPHIAFDFCKTAKTKLEYEKLLDRALQIQVNHSEFREQSLQFYAMHNLIFPEEHIQFRNEALKIIRNFNANDILDEDLISEFVKFKAMPCFGWMVDNIVNNSLNAGYK